MGYAIHCINQKHPHGRGEDNGLGREMSKAGETPPRAWGRQLYGCRTQRLKRNTPTGVGKTREYHIAFFDVKKHPHGRGEDLLLLCHCLLLWETPPRAWGRQARDICCIHQSRNTPTGVGKTGIFGLEQMIQRKHPHGRGEDEPNGRRLAGTLETPPRAWGRPGHIAFHLPAWGNTPTGVGKTQPIKRTGNILQKHPHGRGEDRQRCQKILPSKETPPRAWGRLCLGLCLKRDVRNTPTGVGKTILRSHRYTFRGKHPHGRGEDGIDPGELCLVKETPPRAWGRLLQWARYLPLSGNTPTGVGKTQMVSCQCPQLQKHPHGRGEDCPPRAELSKLLETPPRAWGRLSRQKSVMLLRGNTPTGVGKTLLRRGSRKRN